MGVFTGVGEAVGVTVTVGVGVGVPVASTAGAVGVGMAELPAAEQPAASTTSMVEVMMLGRIRGCPSVWGDGGASHKVRRASRGQWFAPRRLRLALQRSVGSARTTRTTRGDLMAYDGPDDLLDLKKAFLAAGARLQELSAPEAYDRAAWDEVHAEQQRLALELHRHPWWAGQENRYKADMDLLAAAKQS